MEKERKKKILKSAIATLAGTSVLVGGLFDSPEELRNPIKTPDVVVDKEHDYSQDILVGLKKKDSKKNKLKELIYKIPIKIRTSMFVPLWFIGSILITFIKLMFKIVLAPILKILLGLLLHAVVMMGIVALCIKILFPDLPLSKIFNKRNIILIFLGSLIMSLADFFMPMVWDNYKIYRLISKIILGLIALAIILKPYISKKLKNLTTYEIVYENQTLELDA